nr:hypothetical protein CFP56_43436 [Quercus suber]
MTWKEKKEMENRKVIALGGKPTKKQRLPLSVARPMMKKRKEREQKMLEERLILGQFGGKSSSSGKRSMGRRKPEDRVLKASEGHFRNGVLDVKHLLHSAPAPAPSRGSDLGQIYVVLSITTIMEELTVVVGGRIASLCILLCCCRPFFVPCFELLCIIVLPSFPHQCHLDPSLENQPIDFDK